MFKNTKFYVAVALIAQSIASLVAFIVLAAKKKCISAAFLAISGVSGAAGAYLMYECYNEEKDFEEYCDGDCESCTECEDCDACEECGACEEIEEDEDFELEGEPFARAAESKDQE
jgi:hypothetical protein